MRQSRGTQSRKGLVVPANNVGSDGRITCASKTVASDPGLKKSGPVCNFWKTSMANSTSRMKIMLRLDIDTSFSLSTSHYLCLETCRWSKFVPLFPGRSNLDLRNKWFSRQRSLKRGTQQDWTTDTVAYFGIRYIENGSRTAAT